MADRLRRRFELELRDELEHTMPTPEGLSDDALRRLGIPPRWQRRLRKASASCSTTAEAADVASDFAEQIFDGIDAGTDAPPGKYRAAAALADAVRGDRGARRVRERAAENDAAERDRRDARTERLNLEVAPPSRPAPETPEQRAERVKAERDARITAFLENRE